MVTRLRDTRRPQDLLGDLLRRSQAAGAHVELHRAALEVDSVPLDVGPPHALGSRGPHGPATTVLVLDILAELRALAADITFTAQSV